MKTYKNLYEQYISDENIKLAIKNVCKHKLKRRRFKELHDNPEKYVDWIRAQAIDFKNDPHTPVTIYDGIQRKKRTIIVPSFREQIIHHMVVNVLKPIFLRPMYEHSYGSIPNRGAHRAAKYIRKHISKGKNIKYCLKMDIKKYFDSVPHEIVKEKLRKQIKDERFLAILFEIIDVNEMGLPLGFYTSQWLANWYLTELDHYIKEQLGAKVYIRYMDDMVIFDSNKRHLHQIRKAIGDQLKTLGLALKGNYQVFRFHYIRDGDRGRFLDFMGFRFYRNRLTLRRSIYSKAIRKARRIYKKLIKDINVSVYECRQMLSYLGWISATDTYKGYLDNIKPYISVQYLERKIGRFDKRRSMYEMAA